MLKLLLIECKDKVRMNILIFKRFGIILILGLMLLLGIISSLADSEFSCRLIDYTTDKKILFIVIVLFFTLKAFMAKNTSIYVYIPTFMHFYSHKSYEFNCSIIIRFIAYVLSRGIVFYFLFLTVAYMLNHNTYSQAKWIFLLLIVTDIFSELIKFICSFTFWAKYFFLIKLLALLSFALLIYLLKESAFFVILVAEILLIFVILKSIDMQRFLNYSKMIYKSNWGFARWDWSLFAEVVEEHNKLNNFKEEKSCNLLFSFPFNIFLSQVLSVRRLYLKQLGLLLLIVILSIIILPGLSSVLQLYCYFIVHSFILICFFSVFSKDTKKHMYFYMPVLNTLQLILSALPYVITNVLLNLLLLFVIQPLWYYKIILCIILDSVLFFVLKIFWQSEKIKFTILFTVMVLQTLLFIL